MTPVADPKTRAAIPSLGRQESLSSKIVHYPRKLFLRRALFQIHLWAGIFLTLYVVLISITGALLVFEDEFTATTLPAGLLLH